MELSIKLRRDIVTFLSSLPSIHEPEVRQTIAYRAGLDSSLLNQISFDGPSAEFSELLVSKLIQYGTLEDGRKALEAFLESAKESVGKDRKEHCDKLIQKLQTTEGEQSSEKKFEEQISTVFFDFVNRQVEWEKVILPSHEEYYLFDGPAGYGKTALLKKIEEQFTHWYCLYVSLSDQNTFTKVAKYISTTLHHKPDIYPDNPRRTGVEIGISLALEYQAKQFKGVAFLFDVDREPCTPLKETTKILIKELIPGIYDGLKHGDPYFKYASFHNTGNSQVEYSRYKVVFAGRYLATYIKELNYTYSVTRLRPFDYPVTLAICKRECSLENEQQLEDFAAHTLFYSGGHPQCIVKILQLFNKMKYPLSDFLDYYQDDLKNIAFQEGNDIWTNIKTDLREIFDILCIYRRLDHILLEPLIKEFGWQKDSYTMKNELIDSYLLNIAEDNGLHLKDDITRRILALRQFHESPLLFQKACEQAKRFYLQRLKKSEGDRVFWAIEVLFEYLQAHIDEIHNKEKRQLLQRRFLNEEVPEVLLKLVQAQDPRYLYEHLLGVLSRDWEFRFTLNYYLRNDSYDDTPYNRFKTSIQEFFSQLSQMIDISALSFFIILTQENAKNVFPIAYTIYTSIQNKLQIEGYDKPSQHLLREPIIQRIQQDSSFVKDLLAQFVSFREDIFEFLKQEYSKDYFLKEVCFRIGINYNILDGQNVFEKSISLTKIIEGQKKLYELFWAMWRVKESETEESLIKG